jgi:hypothetical protein
MRTIQDLAKEAIQVQDACNLSGVVHGFSRAMTELREILRATGGDLSTDAVNTHPICRMWASKIHDLARMGFGDSDAFSNAFYLCSNLAEGKTAA